MSRLKSEKPSFILRVEDGKLVPVTAYDHERIASFRNGSTVYAHLVQPKDEALLRKYWAVLGQAVEKCPTPWKTAEEASDAIKLACGVVNYFKTVTGAFRSYPGSLAGMEDPEFRNYFERAMDVLHHVTGVDPATLKRESVDVGDMETSSGSTSRLPEDGGGAAPTTSPTDQIPAEERDAGGQGRGANSLPEPPADNEEKNRRRNDYIECAAKFIQWATDERFEADTNRKRIADLKEVWKAQIAYDLPFVKECYENALLITRAKRSALEVKKILDRERLKRIPE